MPFGKFKPWGRKNIFMSVNYIYYDRIVTLKPGSQVIREEIIFLFPHV